MSVRRTTVITLTALPLLLAGCSKDEPASPAPPSPATSSSDSPTSDSPAPTTSTSSMASSSSSSATSSSSSASGSSSSAASSSSSASSSSAVKVSPGKCRYVDLQKLSTAAGTPLEETAAGETMCFFDSEKDDGPSFTINHTTILIDVKTYVDGTRKICEGPVKEGSTGDQSWACKTGLSTQAFVVKGRDIYTLDVKDVDEDAAALDLAVKALGAITPK